MWKAYLLVALGGALGAMARFAIGGFATRNLPEGFPWGTLAVNLAGCFLLGALGGWIALQQAPPANQEIAAGQVEESDRMNGSPNVDGDNAELIFLLKHAIAVGFLGALTTFSTFAFETNALGRDSSFWLGAFYAGGSVVVGLIFVRAGIILAEALAG